MTTYLSPADLAEMLGTSANTVLEWRRQYGWPSLKIGHHIRFSPEHVEQILAMHEAKPAEARPVPDVVVAGQTARSARRRRRAS